MKNILQEIKDCCSVRINCGKCGSGESVYFIPESIISKLEVAVAKMETTTSTCKDSLQVGDMAAMRDALLMVKKLFDGRIMFQPAIREAHKAVDAALAAPPRNCDRFGGDIDKLREACLRERGLNPEEDFPDVFPDWLLAPSTEKKGGASEQ